MWRNHIVCLTYYYLEIKTKGRLHTGVHLHTVYLPRHCKLIILLEIINVENVKIILPSNCLSLFLVLLPLTITTDYLQFQYIWHINIIICVIDCAWSLIFQKPFFLYLLHCEWLDLWSSWSTTSYINHVGTYSHITLSSNYIWIFSLFMSSCSVTTI